MPFPPAWEIARVARRLQEQLPDLIQRYHIRSLGVFGSYTRNEQRSESDLDVLVEFDDIWQQSLLTVAALKHEISDLLGVRVDLVLRDGLRPGIGERIVEEVVWL
ncbi:MAG: nucleotidyltransferase family protein [Chloroflexaceae bacterium]|nr:nucleotidyltransferase family protein [Chloroflexaceae bacterium]